MAEIPSALSQRLVIGRKQDGRRRYDPQAKRELTEACLVPGVSVARLTLEHGLNANLLRTRITRHKKERDGAPPVAQSGTAVFVPVITRQAPAPRVSRLQARLPNGVEITLNDAHDDAVLALLQALSTLTCSASTKA